MPCSVTSHRSAAGGLFGRFAGLTFFPLAVLLALPAAAQQPAASQPPAETPAPAESDPAAVDPAAPAGEAAPPANAAPRRATVDPTEAAAELEQPKPMGAALPPDFTPPPAELPPVMTLRNPLMTDEEITKEENDLRRAGGRGIDTIMRLGEPSAENKAAIQRWARLQVAKMTAAKEWREAGNISKDVILKIRNAGIAQQNPNREREFREAVCSAMAEACKSVLDNNGHVRLQAALILSQLDLVPEEVVGANRKPPVSYVEAIEPLLDILVSEEQPEAVKVAAAAGIGRLADNGVVPPETKYRAGDVLTAELAKSDTFWWYQVRLAEALAAIELDYNKARQPIVIESLMATIADDTRHCLARTAAAKALSRTRAPAGTLNEKAAADRLVQLARDMSLAYNKDPRAIHWHECYWNLADAFRPVDQNEVSQLPADSLLRKGSLPAAYQDALTRITPVVKHVFSKRPGERNQPIPQEMIQRLNEFLAAAQ